MTLHVYGARLGTRDPDRLDVTRKGNDPVGVVFAPSETILRAALDLRYLSRDLAGVAEWQCPDDGLRATLLAAPARIAAAMWALYSPAYVAEMRENYRRDRSPWERLLARDRVVLTCFCVAPTQCHRYLLGATLLPKLGAVWCGEVGR